MFMHVYIIVATLIQRFNFVWHKVIFATYTASLNVLLIAFM